VDTKDLTNDDVANAFKRLEPSDQAQINTHMKTLRDNIRARRGTNVMFGEKQTKELLAKLGIWLNKKESNWR
jgi:hypothetical protein